MKNTLRKQLHNAGSANISIEIVAIDQVSPFANISKGFVSEVILKIPVV
jgi:hypothetical protein